MPFTQQQLAAMNALLAGTHDKFVGPQMMPDYTLQQVYGGILPNVPPPVPAMASMATAASRAPVVNVGSQTIQSLPSGAYKTAGPVLAGSAVLPSDYRPPQSSLPYNGNSIQQFDPLNRKPEDEYFGNLPGAPPQVAQTYAPAPLMAPPTMQTLAPLKPVPPGNYGAGLVKAYNEQLVPRAPQSPALQAIEVAENVPLPRARPPNVPDAFLNVPVGTGVIVPDATSPGGQSVIRRTSTGYVKEYPTTRVSAPMTPRGYAGLSAKDAPPSLFPRIEGNGLFSGLGKVNALYSSPLAGIFALLSGIGQQQAQRKAAHPLLGMIPGAGAVPRVPANMRTISGGVSNFPQAYSVDTSQGNSPGGGIFTVINVPESLSSGH